MNIKKITNFVHFLPLYWMLTGLFIVHNGDKILVGIVIFSILVKIATHIFSIDEIHFNYNNLFIIILAAALYASWSYYSHGYSSSEIRVLITSFLFILISAPKINSIKPNIILILLGLSSLVIMYITFDNFFIKNLNRYYLPLNAIPFSNFIACLGLLSMYIYLFQEKFKYTMIHTLTIVLTFICVILSGTRGTWVALIITYSLMGLIFYSSNALKKKTIISSSLIFGFLLLLVYPHLKHRFDVTMIEINRFQESNLHSSSGIRLQLWQVGLNIIYESPSLTGFGQKEHLSIIQDKFKKGEVSQVLAHFDNKNFHNSYIDRTVKYGFIGLGIFLAFLGYPFYRGLKEKDPRLKIPLVTLPIFVSVAALTYVPLSHPGTFFLYIFIMHYYIQASDMAREKRLEATNA